MFILYLYTNTTKAATYVCYYGERYNDIFADYISVNLVTEEQVNTTLIKCFKSDNAFNFSCPVSFDKTVFLGYRFYTDIEGVQGSIE